MWPSLEFMLCPFSCPCSFPHSLFTNQITIDSNGVHKNDDLVTRCSVLGAPFAASLWALPVHSFTALGWLLSPVPSIFPSRGNNLHDDVHALHSKVATFSTEQKKTPSEQRAHNTCAFWLNISQNATPSQREINITPSGAVSAARSQSQSSMTNQHFRGSERQDTRHERVEQFGRSGDSPTS